MDTFRAKARQVAAAEQTADGLVRLEAKVDRLLAHLNVPGATEETQAGGTEAAESDEAGESEPEEEEGETPKPKRGRKPRK